MADDWRVSVSLLTRSHAEEDSPWTAAMRTLPGRVSSDVEVSQTGMGVFLYLASAHAAALAEQVAREVLAEHGVTADVRCDQWNPISKSWTSHEKLMSAERRKSATTGRAAWLVRVGPRSRRGLKALARRLEADGFSVARRWRYLFAGANCEDDAHALADQIRGYGSVRARIRAQRVYGRPPPVRVSAPRVGPIWVEARNEWQSV